MTASNISHRIHTLPSLLIDRIAAGEVVEGPHSAVKELLENSLDAGASSIRIETTGAGMERIVIEDDGCGIAYEDFPLSIERHATSKISTLDDLVRIDSFGFRGEALASLAAVSHLTIKSRRAEEELGGFLESRGGELIQLHKADARKGTVITAEDLFYSVPARRKFVRSPRTENQRVYREIVKIALANPAVEFRYFRDGKEFLNLRSRDRLLDRIGQIFRSGIEKRLIALDARDEHFTITGYISDDYYHRSIRDIQYQYVNDRHVELRYFSQLVRRAYGEILPQGAHPCYFLFLTAHPELVDVNVHPAKKEVRLREETSLNSLLIRSIGRTLRPDSPLSFPAEKFARRRPGSGRIPAEDSPPSENLTMAVDHILADSPSWSIPGRLDNSGIEPSSAAREENVESVENGESGSLIEGGEATASQIDDSRVASDFSAGEVGTRKPFLPLRHFGLVYGTYILAEGEDGLYIIDQHTAHERINYEEKRRQLGRQVEKRQLLLEPLILPLAADELETILANREELLKNGFILEEFGPDSVVVREVPSFIEPGSEREIVEHALHRFLEKSSMEEVFDEIAALRACKASIKKNDHISPQMISEILGQLSRCESPSRCPHGRPTMIKISRKELDILFHRS